LRKAELVVKAGQLVAPAVNALWSALGDRREDRRQHDASTYTRERPPQRPYTEESYRPRQSQPLRSNTFDTRRSGGPPQHMLQRSYTDPSASSRYEVRRPYDGGSISTTSSRGGAVLRHEGIRYTPSGPNRAPARSSSGAAYSGSRAHPVEGSRFYTVLETGPPRIYRSETVYRPSNSGRQGH
jgi:hypothetical protein